MALFFTSKELSCPRCGCVDMTIHDVGTVTVDGQELYFTADGKSIRCAACDTEVKRIGKYDKLNIR